MLCAVFSRGDRLLRGGGEKLDSELPENLRFRHLCSSCGPGREEDTGLARYGCAGMAMELGLDSSSGPGGA